MSPQNNRGRRPSTARKPRSSRPAPAPLQPLESPPEVASFAEWPGLGTEVLGAIAEMGITVPTPIQALSIGAVLAGKDMIAKAETGTGKTLAFGAPMVAKVDPARRSVLGLVLSPTRELAEQVFQVLATLGAKRGLKCNLIVGGEPMQPQVKNLKDGAQIVVGTPGRVLDLMNQGFLTFPWTEFVVLDEADKMLEIGFIDDVKKILEASNEYRQTLLFSATFPPALLELARAYTRDPLEVATASGVSTADTVAQYYLEVNEDDRAQDLRNLIRASGPKDVFLVFCDRRTDVDRMIRRLERERFSVKALHGGYDQASRFRVMDAFRTGDVKVLVATDVASRGLDVNHVTHVVNLNAPRDVSDYTHRIGRTGRAGRTGTAITFVGGVDRRRWRDVEDALPKPVGKLQTVYELFEEAKPRRSSRTREESSERSPRERDRDGDRNRDRERPTRPARGRNSEEARDTDRDAPAERGRSRRPAKEPAFEAREKDEEPRQNERPPRARRSPRPSEESEGGRPRKGPRPLKDREEESFPTPKPRETPKPRAESKERPARTRREERPTPPLQEVPREAKKPKSQGARPPKQSPEAPGGFGAGL
ncbi:MAG: DEAD/DEAH box helicase [Planctomycetes bacterium]|nr:DEAD/DEAH box helicase [Planctomycetota bacterium]HPF13728.1 DEAD/DEAH box helicase [Planctomycetota bacterium]